MDSQTTRKSLFIWPKVSWQKMDLFFVYHNLWPLQQCIFRVSNLSCLQLSFWIMQCSKACGWSQVGYSTCQHISKDAEFNNVYIPCSLNFHSNIVSAIFRQNLISGNVPFMQNMSSNALTKRMFSLCSRKSPSILSLFNYIYMITQCSVANCLLLLLAHHPWSVMLHSQYIFLHWVYNGILPTVLVHLKTLVDDCHNTDIGTVMSFVLLSAAEVLPTICFKMMLLILWSCKRF